MGIERDGKIDLITKDDEEVSAKPGQIHQFFIHDESPGDMTVLLSASDSGKDYQLDRIFFENWYGYWHDALLHDGGLNIFQFLSVSPIPYLETIGKDLTFTDSRWWRCVLGPAVLDPYASMDAQDRGLLGFRHWRPLDWWSARLQAFLQRYAPKAMS